MRKPHPDISAALGQIRAADQGRRDMAASIPELVERAVGLGCTWAEIAEALGVTRQYAWERYHGATQ